MVKAIAMTKTIRATKRSDIGGSSSDPTGKLLSRRSHYRVRARKGKAELSLPLSAVGAKHYEPDLVGRAARRGDEQERGGPDETGSGKSGRWQGPAEREDRRAG